MARRKARAKGRATQALVREFHGSQKDATEAQRERLEREGIYRCEGCGFWETEDNIQGDGELCIHCQEDVEDAALAINEPEDPDAEHMPEVSLNPVSGLHEED